MSDAIHNPASLIIMYRLPQKEKRCVQTDSPELVGISGVAC